MNGLPNHKSGKWEDDENFPVASILISARQRSAMKAFYRFARSADDAADNSQLDPDEKLRILEKMELTLLGKSDEASDALPLRRILQERDLVTTHAQDLLVAFRQDVIKRRYKSWEELIQYCSYSANPVGRFILDIHGENKSIYPYSDTLCTTLQIINHLQDCKKDFLDLDRIYIPLDMFDEAGIDFQVLSKNKSSENFLMVLRGIIKKTMDLKPSFLEFSKSIKDKRLSFEVAVITALASKLLNILNQKDPLHDKVHLNYLQGLSIFFQASLSHIRRLYF